MTAMIFIVNTFSIPTKFWGTMFSAWLPKETSQVSASCIRKCHVLLRCTSLSPKPAAVNALGPIDMNYNQVSDLHVFLSNK